MRREFWNEQWGSREPPRAEPHVRLAEGAGELPPARALDLACGAGSNAVWLARRGWQVTAVDFSPVAIASARELAAATGVAVDWVVCDLLEFVPEPGAYDLVLVFFLHLPPAQRGLVFTRAAAAVAPGGTLLVAAHDSDNLHEGHHGPKDAELLYRPDEVVSHLDGFAIEAAATLRRPIETPEGPAVMVDALVRARRPGG